MIADEALIAGALVITAARQNLAHGTINLGMGQLN
jgi:hypothetical protein